MHVMQTCRKYCTEKKILHYSHYMYCLMYFVCIQCMYSLSIIYSANEMYVEINIVAYMFISNLRNYIL